MVVHQIMKCDESSLLHGEVVANFDPTLPVNKNCLWHIDVKKQVRMILVYFDVYETI